MVHAFGSTIIFKKESSHQIKYTLILVSRSFNFIIDKGLKLILCPITKKTWNPTNRVSDQRSLHLKIVKKCHFGYVEMSELKLSEEKNIIDIGFTKLYILKSQLYILKLITHHSSMNSCILFGGSFFLPISMQFSLQKP
jgi:hypothetical protein